MVYSDFTKIKLAFDAQCEIVIFILFSDLHRALALALKITEALKILCLCCM